MKFRLLRNGNGEYILKYRNVFGLWQTVTEYRYEEKLRKLFDSEVEAKIHARSMVREKVRSRLQRLFELVEEFEIGETTP